MQNDDDGGSATVGRTIGCYVIEARLGAGGMGEVFRARDTRLGRPVAIKLLPAEVREDAERFRRFNLEARTASSLNHPHIIVIHDIGEVDGRPFIVSELIEGRTLRQILSEGPVPARLAIDIGAQIASALAAAHGRGIVHRDIKPENIMVRPDGYLKVLDFGLAKLTSVDDDSTQTSADTHPGLVMGTPEYMSPEQAAGEAVDYRSDQFAFGVLMYELLSHRRPFYRRSPVLTAAAVITDTPEPLSRLCPDMPPPLRWSIERCLQKRRDDRYLTTDDLHREMTTIQSRISDVRPPAALLPVANLPAAPTTLIGRDDDAAAVRALLEQPGVRWLTLTGPGGVGKTRLATHVAREVSESFAGATYFVPLAGVRDTDQLLANLAQVFEVAVGVSDSPLTAVVRHLRSVGAPVLLILDNFEHIAAAAVQIAELLEQCETIKVLASSRARLNISAEHEYEVTPLMTGPAGQARSAQAAAAVPAVRLFVDRARSARAGFALTDENAAAVTDICLALDGLPLAIELAAARVKVMSPEALRLRVTGRSLSLDGGARDRPARQQTLRATIDWSYELLSPSEQRLFRRLGVFLGGFTVEAVEAVCNAREDLGVDVFDGLSSLVDRSLLRPLDAGGFEPRFTMLATIREYAIERLEAAGELAATRRAHAAYFLVLVEDAGPADAQTTWLAMCDVETRNLRAAIDHLIETGNAEWAMRLTAGLLPFFQARARLHEGRDALTRALALPSTAGRTSTRARALFALGAIVHPMGESAQCEALQTEAFGIYRELGDTHGQAVALNALGVSYHRMERYDEARTAFGDAVALWQQLGRGEAAVRALANLASVAFDAGEHARAIELYQDARARCERTGDAAGAAWAINGEARAEHFRGEHETAVRLYSDALARFETMGDGWGIGDCQLALGLLDGEAGNKDAARARLASALEVSRQVGDVRGTARVIEAAAHLAIGENQRARALTLAGAAAAMRRTLAIMLPGPQQQRLDATLDAVRRSLDPKDAGTAWMRGWSLSPEQALALAFE